MLKPLQDAIKAGDNIRAVIRGTGLNQDGRTIGISTPSAEAQAALIRSVYETAHLDLGDTSYIEAHGTGTTVGDPLEATALEATFIPRKTLQDPIYLGSAKSNFGHLEGASGLVSLIKTAMMLEKRIILPNANFENPNPKISSLGKTMKVCICIKFFLSFEHIPGETARPVDQIQTCSQPLRERESHADLPKVLKAPLEWPSNGLRRASVNNLGFGGTNSHFILEEAPPLDGEFEIAAALTGIYSRDQSSNITARNGFGIVAHHLYILTANDRNTVKSQMNSLVQYLKKCNSGPSKLFLSDLAFTLGQRRSLLPWRITFVASSTDGLIGQLESVGALPVRATKEPRLGFIFTGQGAGWHAMGRELLQTYPVFSLTVTAADKHLINIGSSWSLIGSCDPPSSNRFRLTNRFQEELSKDEKHSQVGHAHISQPACTAIQLGLVELLKSWGVRPHAVTGHSSGEIAAAFATGALTLESCMSIAYFRGLLAAKMKENHPEVQGAMLAVGASQKEMISIIEQLGSRQVDIACVNSPCSITASGDIGGISELQKAVEKRKLFSRRLDVDTAYHYLPHMDLLTEDYRKAIGVIKPALSKDVKFFSSLLGKETNTRALGPTYWVSNLKSPVQFSDSLAALCSIKQGGPLNPDEQPPEGPVTHLIEIGPHCALKGPVRDVLAGSKSKTKPGYSPSLVRNENSVVSVLKLASELFMKGCQLDMSAINCPIEGIVKPRVLSNLPPYPWNHENDFWHDSRLNQGHCMRSSPRNDVLGSLTADSNDLEPRWRNVIRLDDIPWVSSFSPLAVIVA